MQAAVQVESLGIDVGLVEPVEEHEALRSRLVELGHKLSERRIKGRQFHRHRDTDDPHHFAHHLDGLALDRLRTQGQVEGHPVQIELQGVGAGMLHELRVLEPSSGSGAIERRDDGNRHRHLHPPQVLEVFIRPEHEGLRRREVGQGLGEGLLVRLRLECDHLLALDLLLEEGSQNDGGSARVLQPAHRIDGVREGRGPGDERVRQLEAQVTGGQVHHSASTAGFSPG